MGARAVLLALLLGSVLACSDAPAPSGAIPDGGSRPHVVLIVVDTLRADHLGSYGYARPVSPNLDRLAADSWVYERAIAPAPWTNPSLQGVFTGIHPHSLGFEHDGQEIPQDVETLGSLLHDRGYQAYGVVSHHFVKAKFGFARGFDAWDEAEAQGHDHVSSPQVTDKAIEMLDADARDPNAPLFLFVHYFDPHYSYLVHDGFDFSADAEARRRASSVPPIPRLRRIARAGNWNALRRQALVDAYDSEIAYTDHQIGRLLRALEERGLYDSALVIFTADHGEAFGERPERWIGHTRSLFQEVVRVPLFMKLPEAPAENRGTHKGRRSELVTTLDVLPSVIEIADADPPSGRSLLAAEASASASGPGSGRPVFTSTRRDARRQAVIGGDGRWKLVYDEDRGEERLYDLLSDPSESRDRSADHPQERAALAILRAEWAARGDSEAARRRATRAVPELSEEERERLRALGYTE